MFGLIKSISRNLPIETDSRIQHLHCSILYQLLRLDDQSVDWWCKEMNSAHCNRIFRSQSGLNVKGAWSYDHPELTYHFEIVAVSHVQGFTICNHNILAGPKRTVCTRNRLLLLRSDFAWSHIIFQMSNYFGAIKNLSWRTEQVDFNFKWRNIGQRIFGIYSSLQWRTFSRNQSWKRYLKTIESTVITPIYLD